jgi:hypothetical protein
LRSQCRIVGNNLGEGLIRGVGTRHQFVHLDGGIGKGNSVFVCAMIFSGVIGFASFFVLVVVLRNRKINLTLSS